MIRGHNRESGSPKFGVPHLLRQGKIGTMPGMSCACQESHCQRMCSRLNIKYEYEHANFNTDAKGVGFSQ